jgi:hypothetical protein
MKAKATILLALAIVTIANAGCCRTCRNWLQRGSLCGTTTVAPATMGAPVALGTPYVQPQMAAPMQQVVMPQANCQCMPQCVPMCQPCCDPCATMCSPCGPGTWSGGYMESGCCEGAAPATGYDSGTTIVPSTQQPTLPPGTTYAPLGGTSLTDPGPATVNYPESTKSAN